MSHITRRRFLDSGVLTGGALTLAVRAPWLLAEPAGEMVEAQTEYGRVRGRREDSIVIFKGIPYAGPVNGKNRFKQAPPLQKWSGIRDALTLGAPSLQPNKTYYGIDEPDANENCLFLNVWTPAVDGKKRPVMFYSHGGGFTTGSGGAVYQDGGNLARRYDVVVVASNHRLGLLGYLYLGQIAGEQYRTSGNQGLLDISDALKWVNGNIANLGGDPHNVMIFGESGGGAKTSCLYGLPAAKDYFNKASIESSPGIRMTDRATATETAKLVLKYLNLSDSEWSKLLEIPASKLLQAQVAVGRPPGAAGFGAGDVHLRPGVSPPRPGSFEPVVDGFILPHHPFDPVAPALSKNKSLIVGTNEDETAFFFMQQHNTANFNLTEEELKKTLHEGLGPDADQIIATYKKSRPGISPADLYIAVTTARFDVISAQAIAERKFAQNGAPVYMYVFTHPSNYIVPGTTHTLGAGHALEIPYKFWNIHEGPPRPQPGQGSTQGMDVIVGTDPGRMQAAHNMSEFWATYARTGRPAAVGQPAWPSYTLPRRATMLIDTQCRVVDDLHRLEREMWQSFYVKPGKRIAG